MCCWPQTIYRIYMTLQPHCRTPCHVKSQSACAGEYPVVQSVVSLVTVRLWAMNIDAQRPFELLNLLPVLVWGHFIISLMMLMGILGWRGQLASAFFFFFFNKICYFPKQICGKSSLDGQLWEEKMNPSVNETFLGKN